MITIFLLIVFVLIVLVAVVLAATSTSKEKPEPTSQSFVFYGKKPLSEREQQFYFRLLESLPELCIFPQVSMSAIVGCKQQAGRNAFNRKYLDYVICQKDMTVVAAIELDDSTHSRADSIIRDKAKDRALIGVGIRIVRFEAAQLPEKAAIRLALGLTG